MEPFDFSKLDSGKYDYSLLSGEKVVIQSGHDDPNTVSVNIELKSSEYIHNILFLLNGCVFYNDDFATASLNNIIPVIVQHPKVSEDNLIGYIQVRNPDSFVGGIQVELNRNIPKPSKDKVIYKITSANVFTVERFDVFEKELTGKCLAENLTKDTINKYFKVDLISLLPRG